MQVERQYGVQVTSIKYYLLISPLCTRLNAKEQSSNRGYVAASPVFINSVMGRQRW